MIRKFIFATLNVDEDIIKDIDSQKEINLIYLSFVRLFLSSVVVFGITLYACYNVPALAGLYAWLVALVVAMIVFYFDSAIIGSEWDRPQSDEFLLKIKRLLPRIVFSVVIAFFIAGIAELALQKDAIEEVLVKSAKKHNDESGNTEERKGKVDEYDAEINRLNEQKKDIEASIEVKDKDNFEDNLETLKIDRETLTGTKKSIESNLRLLKDNKNKVADLRSTINDSQRLMNEEIDPNSSKCRGANAEKCKGPRYQKHFTDQLDAENQLKAMGNIDGLDSKIKEEMDELDSVNAQLAYIDGERAKVSSRTRPQLEGDVKDTEDKIEKAELKKKTELAAFDEEQTNLGKYINPKKYDFLLLYLGLHELYNDEKKGFPAQKFSWALFGFIVLMELSSVITAMFFLPYSIYASKAYVKVRERQVKENEEVSRFKNKTEAESFATRAFDEGLKAAKEKAAQQDNGANPTPPPPTS